MRRVLSPRAPARAGVGRVRHAVVHVLASRFYGAEVDATSASAPTTSVGRGVAPVDGERHGAPLRVFVDEALARVRRRRRSCTAPSPRHCGPPLFATSARRADREVEFHQCGSWSEVEADVPVAVDQSARARCPRRRWMPRLGQLEHGGASIGQNRLAGVEQLRPGREMKPPPAPTRRGLWNRGRHGLEPVLRARLRRSPPRRRRTRSHGERQQPVVGADKRGRRRAAHRHRTPLGSHFRVDDRHVHAERRVRQRVAERPARRAARSGGVMPCVRSTTWAPGEDPPATAWHTPTKSSSGRSR